MFAKLDRDSSRRTASDFDARMRPPADRLPAPSVGLSTRRPGHVAPAPLDIAATKTAISFGPRELDRRGSTLPNHPQRYDEVPLLHASQRQKAPAASETSTHHAPPNYAPDAVIRLMSFKDRRSYRQSLRRQHMTGEHSPPKASHHHYGEPSAPTAHHHSGLSSAPTPHHPQLASPLQMPPHATEPNGRYMQGHWQPGSNLMRTTPIGPHGQQLAMQMLPHAAVPSDHYMQGHSQPGSDFLRTAPRDPHRQQFGVQMPPHVAVPSDRYVNGRAQPGSVIQTAPLDGYGQQFGVQMPPHVAVPTDRSMQGGAQPGSGFIQTAPLDRHGQQLGSPPVAHTRGPASLFPNRGLPDLGQLFKGQSPGLAPSALRSDPARYTITAVARMPYLAPAIAPAPYSEEKYAPTPSSSGHHQS